MFSYYLEKGYSLKELETLTFLEKTFLQASMKLHIEANENAIKEIRQGG